MSRQRGDDRQRNTGGWAGAWDIGPSGLLEWVTSVGHFESDVMANDLPDIPPMPKFLPTAIIATVFVALAVIVLIIVINSAA